MIINENKLSSIHNISNATKFENNKKEPPLQ